MIAVVLSFAAIGLSIVALLGPWSPSGAAEADARHERDTYETETAPNGMRLFKIGAAVINKQTKEPAIVVGRHATGNEAASVFCIDVIVVRGGTRVGDVWYDAECDPIQWPWSWRQ